MKVFTIAAVAALAVSTAAMAGPQVMTDAEMDQVVAGNPAGSATGGIASAWGGATSDHVTGGLATEKAGGRNMAGGRPD